MIITNESELLGMQKVSEAVAMVLKEMINYAQPGLTTKRLDSYGGALLSDVGVNSAPLLAYGFPGHTCISVNNEICHGIPSNSKILKDGDLINIDVSAELNGFWSDNGASSIIGNDIHQHQRLIDASKEISKLAIQNIKGGIKISDIGLLIETQAKKRGYKVIKNLAGHGIGRKLHEHPHKILNHRDKLDQRRFGKNSVIAIETFISTVSTYAEQQNDGWTMIGNKGGYVAQHEHTIIVTNDRPEILTIRNEIYS
ncbi:methionine aminopeptidase, type I [Pedobacter westerhofensis]|uniref:Methionine aminopeptidase n=1 Tax=Pedobacter westerhofensis TaxID=425512 RepID=A0A521FVZ9_9SPHI|nr:type I methionyl aminopeptidase [Pedobacter westerhofensis]SMO99921.1 methionine aminopeptidase, type I [Pedobacter westerhofensis]